MSHAVDAPPGHQAQILAEFSDEPIGMYLPHFVDHCGIKKFVIFFYFIFLFEFGTSPCNCGLSVPVKLYFFGTICAAGSLVTNITKHCGFCVYAH